MSGGMNKFGTFGEKIAAAIASARAREAAYAAQESGTPAGVTASGAIIPAGVQNVYGDMFIIPITFTAAGDLFVLERPKNKRVLLVVVNTIALNTINFAFGRAADNVSGIPITSGGNVFFDTAVPQNDLHVFSPAVGTILVGYINNP